MVKNKNISIHDPVTKEKLLVFKSKFSALKFIITTQFYGEIRDNATRTDLKRILSSAVGDLFAEICHTFEEKIQIYKEDVEKIKREFSKELLEDMNKELNLVLEQYEDKENEIKRYYELVDILKKIEEELNYV